LIQALFAQRKAVLIFTSATVHHGRKDLFDASDVCMA